MNAITHTTPQSKRIFMIPLVVLTCFALLLAGCSQPAGSATPTPSGNQGSFLLHYTKKSNGGEIGGPQVDVSAVWTGRIESAPEASSAAGDSFTVPTSGLFFPNDYWYANGIADNLNPGNWHLKLSINDGSMVMECQIMLAPGAEINVSFPVEEAGQFNGCM